MASILAGQTVGVAPGVQVYYMATPGAATAAPSADALRHILEINETLPEGEKIRAVSVSAAPGDRDLFETPTSGATRSPRPRRRAFWC